MNDRTGGRDLAAVRTLEEKTAIVTGAGGGFGRGISRAPGLLGVVFHVVHAVARTAIQTDEVIWTIEAAGGAGMPTVLGAGRLGAILEGLRPPVTRERGPARILVTCWGTCGPMAPVAAGDPSEWIRLIVGGRESRCAL